MEELARQVQSYVDAYSDPDNVSWTDSRFYAGSRRAGGALVPSLRRHVTRQVKDFMETEPAQRRFRGRVWWNAGGAGGDGAACGGKVQAPGTDGAGRGRADKGRGQGHGKERNQVAGMDSEVSVCRCFARLPNVLVSFPKCLMTARMLVVGSLLVKGPSSGN